MKEQRVFYRSIWRWHFYAGLFCIPFIIVLSLSGAIYLFKPQIEDYRESAFNNLPVTAVRKTPNAHIHAALQVVPGAKFQSYRLPRQQNDAVRVSVFSDQHYLVYVDPYTLEALHVVALDSIFIEWIKNLHGELLAGDTGSIVVELAASWTIVLLLTGLYLWWPRNSRGLGGILYPRLRTGGRSAWKELHSVIGIWVSFFALFLLISGLPWTTVWGTSFKQSREWVQHVTTQDWSTSASAQKKSWGAKAVSEYDLDPILMTSANALKFAWPAELSMSDEHANTWKLASTNQNRPLRQTAWISGATGQVQSLENFSDKKAIDKAIGIGIAVHEGQLFGWFNQLLGVFTAMGLTFLSTSGFILWRKRKPQGIVGAPPALGQVNWPKVAIVPVILLPMLLVSLIGIFIIEQLVLKQIPALRRWLAIET